MDWKNATKKYIYSHNRYFFTIYIKSMKKTLWRWFTLSPVIVGILWLLVSIMFRGFSTAGITSAWIDIVKNFLNRWLWILALISIPLLIIGIVFLSTSKRNRSKNFTVKEIIKYSRASSKKNMSKYLIWFGLYIILQIISSIFGYAEEASKAHARNAVVSLVVYLVMLWLLLWYKNLSLNIVNWVKTKISDIFVSFPKILKFIGAYILMSFIIVIGFILLIIPWIIFSLRLSMIPYLIIDKNVGPIQAIKMSWKMTKWFMGDIIVLNLLCGLINILWILVIFVWLLRTLPLFMIANAYLYKKIVESRKWKVESKK